MPLPELILRFAAIAQLALLAAVAVRSLRPHLTGALFALFAFGVSSYLICPLLARQWDLGPVEHLFYFGCFGNPVFFLMLCGAIFNDGFRPGWPHLILLAALQALGFWNRQTPDPMTPTIVAQQFLSLAILTWALVSAYQGRRGDLVEPRRRVRDVFVAIAGGYMLLVIATEIRLRAQPAPALLELANVAAILALTFLAALFLLHMPPGLFPAARKPAAAPADPEDRALLDKLTTAMEAGAYRTPGLTIDVLADTLGASEHRLRRLINQEQGFRNFNEFLNSYRIAEARARLSDPALRKLPVLTIAMDAGFGSLGPFNRAFKLETGQTPTEFRADRLPNS